MSVIGCDLDGVLFNFAKSFNEIANRRYGRPDVSTQWVDYDGSNLGLAKEEIKQVWCDIQCTDNFWEMVTVLPHVNRELVWAVDDAHTIYFPTARAHTAGRPVGKQTARAIYVNFDIPYPAVFVSNEKGPMAYALQYDYFIDDRPENCIDVKKVLPNCKVFLVSLPHNSKFDAPFNIQRVDNFNEFAKLILKG